MEDQKRSKIEASIKLVAQIIMERDDGSMYLPVYDRLKAELIAMSSQTDRLEEIRQVAMGHRAAI